MRGLASEQLFNASADDLALALFVLRVGGWFHSHTNGRKSAATLSSHPLTLDGLSTSVLTHVGGRLLCLHALSSFQRTGTRPINALRHRHVEDPTEPVIAGRIQGNPPRVLAPLARVNFFLRSEPGPTSWIALPGEAFARAVGLAPARRTLIGYLRSRGLSMLKNWEKLGKGSQSKKDRPDKRAGREDKDSRAKGVQIGRAHV